MTTDNLFLSYNMNKELCKLGIIRKLDFLFGEFIAREDNSDYSRELGLLAALVSYATTQLENVCLDTADPLAVLKAGNPVIEDTEIRDKFLAVCSDIEQLFNSIDLEEVCRSSKIVAVNPAIGRLAYPLIYNDGKLYLQRYWQAESVVVNEIELKVEQQGQNEEVDFSGLPMFTEIYKRFDLTEKTYWQQVAVFAALRNNLTFITGGPGTGKTTVVSVIVALALSMNREIRIALAAPTGKASARLQEALLEELQYLNVTDELREQLYSLDFLTIHRMLGIGKRQGKAIKKLHYDIVIIDESSMVSILLFEKLFKSLRPEIKLILLGDREQLAAVEGGAVLSDVCKAGGRLQAFSSDFVEQFSMVMPPEMGAPEVAENRHLLVDAIVPLDYTFRFKADSGIGRLKKILSEDKSDELEYFLDIAAMEYASSFALHSFESDYAAGIRNELRSFIKNWNNEGCYFYSYIRAGTVEEAFDLFRQFQIITPLNSGLLGAEGINSLMLRELGLHGDKKKGLPVMITKNDYQTGLFNGDIGMYWPDDTGDMKVWFPDIAGEIKSYKAFLPAQLAENMPAFAMTVHKSQGSGFDNVLFLLPDGQLSFFSKELLYTALTRAKKKIDIFASRESLVSASNKKVCRDSGVRGRLL